MPSERSHFTVLLNDTPDRVRLCVGRPSPWVLVLSSQLPGVDRPRAELHSTYIGHPGLATSSTHLTLAVGRDAQTQRVEHQDAGHPEDCLVLFRPRAALYDHAHRLLELLQDLGHDARLRVDEQPIAAITALQHR